MMQSSATATTRVVGGSPCYRQRGGILCKEEGFTLLEVLVAVFLLAVGVLAATTMQTVALQANSISNQLTVASTLTKEALEDILSWDSSTSVFSTAVSNVPYTGVPFNAPPNNTYSDTTSTKYRASYSTTVGNQTNGIPSGVTSVTVTVSYSFHGASKHVTLTGYKRTV